MKQKISNPMMAICLASIGKKEGELIQKQEVIEDVKSTNS